MKNVAAMLMRLACAAVATGAMGSKCVSYDDRLAGNAVVDDVGDDDASDGDESCVAPPVFSVEAMVASVCVRSRCDGPRAAAFWSQVWEDNDTVRVVDLGDSGLGVTDESGAPADLVFAQGLPVTLVVRNSGGDGVTTQHDLTAPIFFHAVGWSDAETADGTYEAPAFDAVRPHYTAGVSHEVTLRFVPIVAGTFDVWSSVNVVGGDDYGGILAGAVIPDLATGDAGLGLKATITVTGDPALAVALGGDVDHDPTLDRDPRRDDDDPIWDEPALRTVTVDAIEDPGFRFRFAWSSKDFTLGAGYVIDFGNLGSNSFMHNLTTSGLQRVSIVRGVADSQAELRSAAVSSVTLKVAKRAKLYLVPAELNRSQAHCHLGVAVSPNGQPDLKSGHAGAGMVDALRVVP